MVMHVSLILLNAVGLAVASINGVEHVHAQPLLTTMPTQTSFDAALELRKRQADVSYLTQVSWSSFIGQFPWVSFVM
jgi:hypothetical protein